MELANILICIRGTTNDGTDDNQERIPLRQQITAMRLTLRANYRQAA